MSLAEWIKHLLAEPRRALLACVVLLSYAACLDVLSDPDVWWHMRLGRLILDTHSIPSTEPFSYTAVGHEFTAHEWLADVIFALLRNAGGLFLVAVVMAVVAWAALIIVWRRAELRGAGPLACAIGLAVAARAAQPVLGTRPQVVSFALTGVVLLIADHVLRGNRRVVWVLPVIFLVWANLHAGFIAGLGFLGLCIGAEVLVSWISGKLIPTADVLRLAAGTAASALAACLNPAGPGLYIFSLTVPGTERQKAIVEWQPPVFSDASLWGLLFLLVSFAALLVIAVIRPDVRSRIVLRDVLCAAVAAGLALYAVRNTAIAAGVIAPVWIALAHDVVLSLRKDVATPARVTPFTVVLGAVIVGLGGATSVAAIAKAAADARQSGVAAMYPACAVSRLATAPPGQHVYVSYGASGYVIDALYPSASVYEYGESISLGPTVFAHYVAIASDDQAPPSARFLLDDSATSAVLTDQPALINDLQTHGWITVVHDHASVLLARADAPWVHEGGACL